MECRWYGLRWLLKGIGKKIRSAVVVFTHDLLICVSSPTHRHTLTISNREPWWLCHTYTAQDKINTVKQKR